MAGSKVSNFATGDSNIQSVMLTLDKTFKGQHQVSLTNYNTTAESQVAAGSVIEIGGALYKFDSNESITGTPSDGTVYIMAVPSGDSVTCAYTNTEPTWSDSKQGWYGTGGTVNNRYLEFVIVKSSSSWSKKIFNVYRKLGGVKGYVGLTVSDVFGLSTGEHKILWQSNIDNIGEWDNSTSKFTAKKTGLYNIKFKGLFDIASLGTGAIQYGYKLNAGFFQPICGLNSSGTQSPSHNLPLTSGDILEFYLSVSITTTAGSSRNFASIQELNI
jgi:hypothetical protein